MTSSGLQVFAGYTLVDVTATGVIRGVNGDLNRDQQRNWETVLQCIGLRTQPHHIQPPELIIGPSEAFEFGEFYQGEQHVWAWTWAIENTGVYEMNNDPIGGLHKDFEQVPIIVGLEETAKFMLPIFYPYGAIKNIYFKPLSSE